MTPIRQLCLPDSLIILLMDLAKAVYHRVGVKWLKLDIVQQTLLCIYQFAIQGVRHSPVAQLVEHSPGQREVVGSNPGLAHYHSCHSSEYVSKRKRVNVRR